MKPIRALVVEDSLTVRKCLVEALSADPDIAVVGEASDGRQAIDLCHDLRPDVITMDMILPAVSGLAATEYIMAHWPTPILVVSSSFNRREVFKTYDALAAGAVDAMEKPDGGPGDAGWAARLVARVKLVAKIRVITHLRGRLHTPDRPPGPRPARLGTAGTGCTVVAIGASTGGPAAIVEVLRGLPDGFRAPVLFVLHIGAAFAADFAGWLNRETGRPAAIAQNGAPVHSLAGRVAVAPAGRHLVVQGGRLRLTDAPERHSCRPSIDVLFETVAAEYGRQAAAVLLTGMGRDGAAGLLALRRAGGATIAQDEASSVVYGMPREAALLGGAGRILPLREIGPALGALAGDRR